MRMLLRIHKGGGAIPERLQPGLEFLLQEGCQRARYSCTFTVVLHLDLGVGRSLVFPVDNGAKVPVRGGLHAIGIAALPKVGMMDRNADAFVRNLGLLHQRLVYEVILACQFT